MDFFGLGLAEVLVIGVLALIFIGPERLPGVLREVMSFYRQIRSLGTQWRTQVEREIGADLHALTTDVNEGLEAFGHSIEREIAQVDAEIRAAQTGTSALAPPPEEFPTLLPPPETSDEDENADDDRPTLIDYLPGR